METYVIVGMKAVRLDTYRFMFYDSFLSQNFASAAGFPNSSAETVVKLSSIVSLKPAHDE